MGIFAGIGVSVNVQDTLPKGRGELDPITDEISAWNHTSAANGGYISASATLVQTQNYIEEWLESGLGRWLTLRDEGGNIGWRGWVDSISANIGGVQIQRGPLSGICNRAYMVYSTVDTSTTPPTVGVRDRTTQTNDTISQGLYAIWQKVLSSGGNTAAGAAQDQAMYLAENASPQTTKTVSFGGGNLSMTLQLRGAWDWLKAYVYNSTTNGLTNLSTRFLAIVAASPNTVYSADLSHVTANTFQVAVLPNVRVVASNQLITKIGL